jgi:hypothetical protein
LPKGTGSCLGPRIDCDIMSLQCKFNSIANTVPPTGDPNIPTYIQIAKVVMRAIEIWMDSGDVVAGDLGIKRGGRL